MRDQTLVRDVVLVDADVLVAEVDLEVLSGGSVRRPSRFTSITSAR